VGGVYFRKDAGGQHIQARPRHVNYAHTVPQSPGIGGFSSASAIWLMACLAWFGASWVAYALIFYFTTNRGERKQITGYNWFIHYALMFPEADRPAFWKPPHSPGELPDYIAMYQDRWTYHNSPDTWPADVCSDYYWEGIEYNGKDTYHNDTFTWFLWWTGDRWALSPGVDYEPEEFTFYSDGAEIKDYYRNPHTKKWVHVYMGKRGR